MRQLTSHDQVWIDSLLNHLTLDDKLRQLFTLICPGHDPVSLETARAFRPGGITRMMTTTPEDERAILAELNANMPVPLFVSADLEGSRMSLKSGAEWPNPLGLAAIEDVEITASVTKAMALEARAMGINWTFTPVADVNAEWRSAIVGTRSFGNDPARVSRHALAQVEAFQAHGIAATVKHFPGEGFDARDQHLLTTINPLTVEDWWDVFGKMYKAAIAQGVCAIMSAHIAFPAYIRSLVPKAELSAFIPASISHHINQNLLRKELGFEGLIVSDATAMAGLGSWGPRSQVLPELVASGCDVILFSDDPEDDLAHLYEALEAGSLTEERIDDALRRQLELKARLNLNDPDRQVPAVDREAALVLSHEVARKAPTLVKDTAKTLPISPDIHKHVLIFGEGIKMPFLPEPIPFVLPNLLETKGHEVTQFTPESNIDPRDYDLILYLFGDETLLTRGHLFLDWLSICGGFGPAMKRYWHEVPTVLVSFGFPYLLYDAPRVPTYINAYSNTETAQRAVVDLLQGKSNWNQDSPIDPFCGLEDARF
ncbi:MAG: glycoside hydrolase family 3 N-terminal domain-containing protein [Rhizobiaceae bacterium]